jgi:PKD repeat protein/predicted GH43/DUF377 family glycosyl hydrolase
MKKQKRFEKSSLSVKKGNRKWTWFVVLVIAISSLVLISLNPMTTNSRADSWIQTSQSDFETGTVNNVDIISDPGNVTLFQLWDKYAGNPVLDTGPGAWEQTDVSSPSVLYDGSMYKMWYTGQDITGWDRIGYATSLDGIIWNKYASNPVVTLGPPGSWDSIYAYCPTVIFNGATYQMWFGGYDGTNYRIGYATSPDGVIWNKYAGNPVLDHDVLGSWDDTHVTFPFVLYKDSMYHMWFTGSDGVINQIGYATSSDGISWTRNMFNPVLEIGPSSSWEERSVGDPAIVIENSGYLMWYTGSNNANKARTGYAVSQDGVDWIKSEFNPVLDLGAPGSWDSDWDVYPTLVPYGSTYRMWYTGKDSANNRKIGLATMRYPFSGILTSIIFDSGSENTLWGSINWTEVNPPGTNITFSTRTGNTSIPDSSWSLWSPEMWDETGSQISSPPGRYIQYRATLSTSDQYSKPVLSDVTIQYLKGAVADAGSDFAVFEDELFTFDGSASTGDILYYNWTFGDGTFNNGSDPAPVHSYSNEGVYSIVLNVTDSLGFWDTDSIMVFVNNIIPTANAGSDMIVDEGQIIDFNGSGSTDTPSDLPNLIYLWYFGDGFVGSGKATNHSYSKAGIYVVTLIVQDDNGETSSDTLIVTVNQLPPELDAKAGQDMAAKEDDTVIFDGSGSMGNVQYYNWSFGDGTYVNGTDPIATHVYSTSGMYNVVLNISDGSGSWDKDGMLVFVSNVPPIADAGSDQNINEGFETGFDGSFSSDTPSDSPSLLYTWYFGDGDVGNGMIVAHTFGDDGTYAVTLVVTDDDGAASLDTLVVTVNNVAPTIQPISQQTATEGIPFSIRLIASDSGSDTLTFSDDTELFDINGISGEISFLPSADDVGIHQITITVTDDEGGSNSIQFSLEVIALPLNSAPVLENPSATTDGLFHVTFKDEDGDSPNEVLLILDGIPYEMALKEGNDFVAGVVYELDLSLDPGRTYNYWFKTTDKNDDIGSTSLATITVPAEEDGIDWILILLIILLILTIILLILSSISLTRKGKDKERTPIDSESTSVNPSISDVTSGESDPETVEGATLTCHNCGAKLEPQAGVCASCGASVGPPPPPPT